MVASTHWLASAAGMAVLEGGGNAFDAAVTAGLVLQVVEPHLNGPGGEFSAIFAIAGDPRPRVLCGQGTAPALATTAHLRETMDLRIIPGTGLLPACVPGAWGGWLTLLRDHGSRSLREVLGYAIGYARDGYPLVERIPATIAAVAERFRAHWPTSAEQWLPGGGVPSAGERFRLTTLAGTFERLLASAEGAGGSREHQIDAGIRAWYDGFVAEEIEKFCRGSFRDESGRDHAGLLTGQDLANWQASYENAVTADFPGGWTLAKCGPWTQGIVLLQQLQLLTGFELSYLDGRPTTDTVHLAVECAKLAFADREAWYGDSPDVPVADLLAPSYVDARRRLVDAGVASRELRPGSPGGREPRLPALLTRTDGAHASVDVLDVAMGTTRDPKRRAGDTVHVDAVDRYGNIISATPSGGWLQSSPTIPALGFCLGTRGQMFWLDDGLPNSLAPGKRPRITLSPSLALRHGGPLLAFGTPGGDQQDQWQLCFWLAHVVGGLNLQAAIDAAAWHSTSFPSSFSPRSWEPGGLVVESRLGGQCIEELRRRGHDVLDAGAWALGRLSAVARDPEGGLLYGAANPRGAQGYAVGR